MELKQCRICGEYKPITPLYFYHDIGRQPIDNCITCCRTQNWMAKQSIGGWDEFRKWRDKMRSYWGYVPRRKNLNKVV